MGELKRRLGQCAAGLAALLALAQPVAAAQEAAAQEAAAKLSAPASPSPAIWVVEDKDTKIYLFGTVHVFAAGLKWRSAAVDRVIAEADELVMETPDASGEEMSFSDRLLDGMALAKPQPVLERVSPAMRPQLKAALAETEIPINYYDTLQTWAVALLLTGFQLGKQVGGEDGATELSGAEDELGALFKARGRPILGVETVDEQLGLFAAMPADAQRMFLESTLDSSAAGKTGAKNGTEGSWVRGDVEGIAAEMQAMPAALYEPLLTKRNRAWSDWLVRRMKRPGTVLFAVGAGHLAGRDSVQQMLAARGLRVRRLD